MQKLLITMMGLLISAAGAGAQSTENPQMPEGATMPMGEGAMPMGEGMGGNMPGMEAAMQMPPITAEMIGESGLRRLTFYANRAVTALEKVVEAADARDIVEQSKVNTQFRLAVGRLVDAGERSDLELEQVAFFFMAAVIDRFGEEFIQKIGQVGGGLDMITLFRNVSVARDARASGIDQGMEFLNTLAESADADPEVALAEGAAENPATAPSAQATRPVPFPNASERERSIIDRVVSNDGSWMIVVERGDSLSLIASAIYGDALLYTAIFQANQDRLRNPNTISVGQRIRLPRP